MLRATFKIPRASISMLGLGSGSPSKPSTEHARFIPSLKIANDLEEIFICGRGYFCSFENLMVIFVVSRNVVVIFAVFPKIYSSDEKVRLFIDKADNNRAAAILQYTIV